MKKSKRTKGVIAVGSDHRGFPMKEKIMEALMKKGYRIEDAGSFSDGPCDYPQFAYAVGREVVRSRTTRGILVCKTGIGNSIVANKVKGVRAALCYNVQAARLSREHNDANVLVLGTDFVNASQLQKIIDTWLTTEFTGGRHSRRIKQIKQIEKNVFK